MKANQIHNTDNIVDSELLFRFFNNAATPEEESKINRWLKESEENKEIYNNTRELHEAFLMDASIELLEGRNSKAARRRKNMIRIIRMSIANAAVLVLFCFLGYKIINDKVDDRLAHTMTTIVVPAGKSMDYILPDGTTVKLNSGAKFSYPMMFAKDSRKVSLEGEAYFDVEHNPEQPFIVNTFAADVKVLGTTFNVYADADEQEFSTTLIQGKVMVTGKSELDQSVTLLPDQRVSMKSGKFIIDSVEAEQETLWTEGLINIRGNDFKELMSRLENAYGVRIVIERETMPKYNCANGKLKLSDGIVHALNMVGKMADFEYIRDLKTNTIYIR